MSLAFKKATKYSSRLRLAFIGPAGSGKTYSALAVATALGGRIAVIDSERGSASKYSDVFNFDVLELDDFSPDTYVNAIHLAEESKYDIIIIDSLSHAWIGKGGALEIKDNVSRRGGENSFTAWRTVTPKHNAMVDAIVGSSCHVIATMRAKTEYVQEKDEKGKTVIRKVGLAPVQRDGLEYEFDVVGDLDQDNAFIVSKTRCSAVAGKIIDKPGAQLAKTLKAWLAGEERPAQTPQEVAENRARVIQELNKVGRATGQPMFGAPDASDVVDPPPDAPTPTVDETEKSMRACKTMAELRAMATSLQGMADGPDRVRLLKVYSEVRTALTSGDAPQEEARA